MRPQVKREKPVSTLRTQVDVIVALTVLAMHTQQGKYRWGYAWSLFEPLMLVTILAVAHLLIRLMSPLNMPPMLFLILGSVPYFMFRKTMTVCFKAINSRRRLLEMGRVTPLDIVISSTMTEFVTYTLVFLLFLAIGVAIEGGFPPVNPFGVICMFICSSLFGSALGLLLASALRYLRFIDKFLSLLNRVGIWTSGAFFVLLQLPQSTWPYLDWNPLLHINELMRQYWFGTYQSPVASPVYIFECLLGVFTFALIFERRIRAVPIP